MGGAQIAVASGQPFGSETRVAAAIAALLLRLRGAALVHKANFEKKQEHSGHRLAFAYTKTVGIVCGKCAWAAKPCFLSGPLEKRPS